MVVAYLGVVNVFVDDKGRAARRCCVAPGRRSVKEKRGEIGVQANLPNSTVLAKDVVHFLRADLER